MNTMEQGAAVRPMKAAAIAGGSAGTVRRLVRRMWHGVAFGLARSLAARNQRPRRGWMTPLPLIALLSGTVMAAPVELTDDAGVTVKLPAPARRIVALAPHVAENLFAIGAGDLLAGTVEYSDFPPPAKQVPRIGGYSRIDIEAVVARKPDLVIGWQSGNSAAQVDRIRAMGIPVYLSQPEDFEGVARELERFGVLTGREAAAGEAAVRFRQQLADLRRANAGRAPVSVFYQIWHTPLMTVGGRQIITRAIEVCGGQNVFADLKPLAPRISEESVVDRNAEAFVAGGMGEIRRDWLDMWKRWPSLTAVKRDNLFFVPADLMQRHTPRLLEGTAMLCKHLDTARARRAASR